jgi:hypothetical protein
MHLRIYFRVEAHGDSGLIGDGAHAMLLTSRTWRDPTRGRDPTTRRMLPQH